MNQANNIIQFPASRRGVEQDKIKEHLENHNANFNAITARYKNAERKLEAIRIVVESLRNSGQKCNEICEIIEEELNKQTL